MEHIWHIPLQPAIHYQLNLYARYDDAGDADNGFRFSYAAGPDGPYTQMFTVKSRGNQNYSWNIPSKIGSQLYIKVEDTDRTAGENRPDVLHVDSLFVMYEFNPSPFGMGDGGVGGFPRDVGTDFGLYGSSHVGYLGSIVETTNVKEILQLDLLKTDWYHDKAYPTYLYFNPYDTARTITLNVGADAKDIYDLVSNQHLVKNVKERTAIRIPADSAVLAVVCPAGGQIVFDKNKTLINGVIVDYNNRRSKFPTAQK